MNDIKYEKVLGVLNIIAKENRTFELSCVGDSTEITIIIFSFLRDLFEQNADILVENKHSLQFKVLELLREYGANMTQEVVDTRFKSLN